MFFKGKINCHQPGGGTQDTEINKTAVCTSERLSEDLEDPHVNALCVCPSLSPPPNGAHFHANTRVQPYRLLDDVHAWGSRAYTMRRNNVHKTTRPTTKLNSKPATANKALQSFCHTSTHTHTLMANRTTIDVSDQQAGGTRETTMPGLPATRPGVSLPQEGDNKLAELAQHSATRSSPGAIK